MSWSPFPGGPVYATGPSGSASSASMASSGYSRSPASFSEGLSKISGITSANNAWSAQQASQLRDWQSSEAEKVRQYNSREAEKNRSWQEFMSSSAHQREIEDLKKAGLNPVLSVLGGNGASTTSGATASAQAPSGAMGNTDFSGAESLVGLLGSFLQQQTQLAQMNTSALTNLAVADKYNAMSKYTAELGASTQLQTTAMNNAVSRFVSQNNLTAAQASAVAQVTAANIHSAAQKYSADKSALSHKEVAEINADINKELKQMDIDAQLDLSYNDFLEEWSLYQHFGKSGQLGSLIGQLGSNAFFGSGGQAGWSAVDALRGSGYNRPGSRGSGFSK